MVMSSEISGEALISKLYYCCNAVIDQQKRIDNDVSKLNTYVHELRTFVESLDRRVASLSATNDQTAGRVDLVEVALRTLGETGVANFGKMNNELQDIRQDIASLVTDISNINIE
jgi:uncharacterized phage infection (PIP) family protein YhgE